MENNKPAKACSSPEKGKETEVKQESLVMRQKARKMGKAHERLAQSLIFGPVIDPDVERTRSRLSEKYRKKYATEEGKGGDYGKETATGKEEEERGGESRTVEEENKKRMNDGDQVSEEEKEDECGTEKVTGKKKKNKKNKKEMNDGGQASAAQTVSPAEQTQTEIEYEDRTGGAMPAADDYEEQLTCREQDE